MNKEITSVLEIQKKDFVIFRMDIPVYNSDVVFFIGKRDTFNEWFKKKYKLDAPETSFRTVAQCIFESENYPNIIYMKDFNWYVLEQADIAHELYHLVSFTLFRAGVIHTQDSEEAFAYLYSCILEKLWWKLAKLTNHHLHKNKR